MMSRASRLRSAGAIVAVLVLVITVAAVPFDAQASRRRALLGFERWPTIDHGDWIYDDVLFLFAKSGLKDPQKVADSACKQLIRDGVASEVTLYVIDLQSKLASKKNPLLPLKELAHAYCNTETPK